MRSLVEWALALGFVWLVTWLALPFVRSLAPPVPGAAAAVDSPLPDLPAGVPAGAERVPVLILEAGSVLERGMPESAVRSQAFARFRAGQTLAGPGGRALVPFRSGSYRFWVVLERTGAGPGRAITAIYVR